MDVYNELKIISFDLIRHYLRDFRNEDSGAEKAKYIEGIVDLYTELLTVEQNKDVK